MINEQMENFLSNIDMYDILDSVNMGIWVIEYSATKGIKRFFGNKTMLRIMGVDEPEKLTPETYYHYWYDRIEKYYLKDVNQCVYNMMQMYNKNPNGYITDEVCYTWNHDKLGKVNVRCGGKVLECVDEVYRLCGYHQDYTDIIKLRDAINYEEHDKELKREIEDIRYLKDYYQELAYVDELTGLVNRRGFYKKIKEVIESKMRRDGDHLWLAILDLDFFKNINDTFGHLSGDKVLRFIGETLFNFSRSYKHSYVFRYGGEEFIILIYQRDYQEVNDILNRYREYIEGTVIKVDEKNSTTITCSIGVTKIESSKGIDVNEIIYNAAQRADKALYRAKQSGRNKVEFKD